jgi:hypothetical protein
MAVAIIDAGAHPHAADWYGWRNAREPAGGGTTLGADSVTAVRGLTLDAALTEILLRARSGGDVILVCHARDAGLALPLIHGGAVRARNDAIGQLAIDTSTTEDWLTTPAVSVSDAARVLMMSEAQVTALRDKMNQVRALRLGRVALRGCNVGAWANTLPIYKRFFGCRSLSGPMLRDTYGQIDPGPPVTNLTTWSAHHNGWHIFLDGPSGNQIAVATHGGQTEEHSYQIAFAYQTTQRLADWGTRHLNSAVSGPFYYHGMWLTSASPGSPRIYFVGDSDYVGHLQVV